MTSRLKFRFLLNVLVVSTISSAQSWTPLSCGSTAQIFNIQFPSDDTGYVLLGNNTLRKTTDAGNNWSACTVPGNSNFAIDFATGLRGCMIQQYGISMTTDGAQTWSPVLNNPAVEFYDVQYVTSSLVFASGMVASWDTAFVFTSTNGGASWTQLPPITQHFVPYPEIYFINATTGFINADQEILKTTNSGMTWTSVYTSVNADAWYSMHSPDGVNIFGGGYLGWIFKSTDGGSSWSENVQMTYPAYGIYFDTPLHGFYCGGNGFSSGAIESTSDGGTTWAPVFLSSQTLSCMDFPSVTRGYVGGMNGVVVRYDDGPQYVSENNSSLISLYPNPATSFVILQNTSPNSVITITNCVGETVATTVAVESQTTVDISTLPSGIYLCQISDGDKTETHKLVVQ